MNGTSVILNAMEKNPEFKAFFNDTFANLSTLSGDGDEAFAAYTQVANQVIVPVLVELGIHRETAETELTSFIHGMVAAEQFLNQGAGHDTHIRPGQTEGR